VGGTARRGGGGETGAVNVGQTRISRGRPAFTAHFAPARGAPATRTRTLSSLQAVDVTPKPTQRAESAI
jgi:hypothetical protein